MPSYRHGYRKGSLGSVACGGAWGGHGHGAWAGRQGGACAGHGRGALAGHRGGAWGHGHVAWGGHGHGFHHGGRFFGPGFGFFGYDYPWSYPGYSYYSYSAPYYDDPYYYGDTYYGNQYYARLKSLRPSDLDLEPRRRADAWKGKDAPWRLVQGKFIAGPAPGLDMKHSMASRNVAAFEEIAGGNGF